MSAKTSKKRAASGAETPPHLNLGWLGGTIGFNLRIAQEASVRTYLEALPTAGRYNGVLPSWRS